MPTIEHLKEMQDGRIDFLLNNWSSVIRVLEAAKMLQVFLDEEIGMDKVELTMLRGALKGLEEGK